MGANDKISVTPGAHAPRIIRASCSICHRVRTHWRGALVDPEVLKTCSRLIAYIACKVTLSSRRSLTNCSIFSRVSNQ